MITTEHDPAQDFNSKLHQKTPNIHPKHDPLYKNMNRHRPLFAAQFHQPIHNFNAVITNRKRYKQR